jgi:hypothetical protein
MPPGSEASHATTASTFKAALVAIDCSKRTRFSASTVSLLKALTKSALTTSLKREPTSGQLRINLHWSAGGRKPIILDPSSLSEFLDTSNSVAQIFGKVFLEPPHMPITQVFRLGGNDRSGLNVAGENSCAALTQVLRTAMVSSLVDARSCMGWCGRRRHTVPDRLPRNRNTSRGLGLCRLALCERGARESQRRADRMPQGSIHPQIAVGPRRSIRLGPAGISRQNIGWRLSPCRHSDTVGKLVRPSCSVGLRQLPERNR